MKISKSRIIEIDIYKVFAVLVVLNSHMELSYGDYKVFATGGAIGDALFFFASGFMLFRGKMSRFDNFMKRRISRIYPTVIIVAIVGALFFERNSNIIDIILYGGGWFVSCIMIYYGLLYFVRRYCINHLKYIWITLAVIIITTYYVFFDHGGKVSMYGDTYFKWVFFFTSMLQGAQMGLNPFKYNYDKWVLPKLIACIALWYSFFILQEKISLLVNFQYISILPLLGITYYMYCLCRASFFRKLYEHNYIGNILFIIGGLCLECYLIQGFFITDKLNSIFPANIPLIIIFILLISYAVNYFSSALGATFRNEDFEWNKYFLRKE